MCTPDTEQLSRLLGGNPPSAGYRLSCGLGLGSGDMAVPMAVCGLASAGLISSQARSSFILSPPGPLGVTIRVLGLGRGLHAPLPLSTGDLGIAAGLVRIEWQPVCHPSECLGAEGSQDADLSRNPVLQLPGAEGRGDRQRNTVSVT